jgi:hypothetical protein
MDRTSVGDTVMTVAVRTRRLAIAAWSLAILAGAIHAWAERHTINVDGVSYLEIADAYRRGDWHAALNAYWSPLFSWILAASLAVLRPAPESEFAAAHAVAFGIYVATAGAFLYLLHEILATQRRDTAELRGSGWTRLPEWAWHGVGFALFLWSSLWFIGLGVKPDLLVSALLCLVGGVLLRMQRDPRPWSPVVALGLLLGFGYLAKAVMLPLAFVFIAVAPTAPTASMRLRRTLVALLIFLATIAPFVVGLSREKGRFTTGDTGRLNYAWFVNRVPQQHWHGEPAGSGVPLHAERKVFDSPTIFEFGTPIAGSYPPWYDPSYWNEGVNVHVSVLEQLRVFLRNVRLYADLFLFTELAAFSVCAVVLFFLAPTLHVVMRDLWRSHMLWFPSIAALSLYALVLVERRYLGGFLILLWVGVFLSVRLPDSRDAQRIARAVTLAILAITTARMSLMTAQLIAEAPTLGANGPAKVSQALTQLHLPADAAVACVGHACYSREWARISRVRIVAEVPPTENGELSTDERQFWAADPGLRTRILTTIRQTGAIAIVAEPPPGVSLAGWFEVGDARHAAMGLTGWSPSPSAAQH